LDVDFLCSCSIDSLNEKIEECFREIELFEEWTEKKENVLQKILAHKF
jgi:uncharacterized protein YlzI (FlbEa/FlbD family)